jgi:hypothetical protein
MKPIKGFFYLTFLVFFIGSSFIGLDAAAVKTIEGLRYIDFDTPYGKIGIGLPDDMAMGDVISGQLAVEPSGRSEKKRAKNEERIKRYSVDIGGQKAAVGDHWGKWTIPPADNVSVVLLDPNGKVVDTAQVPVNPHPPAAGFGDFQCLKVTQGGRLWRMDGKFNGDFSDTNVSMGGNEVEKWAESPRYVILESPMDVVGKTTIQYREGSIKGTCQCRNIVVTLHAAKLKLHKGETTQLSVTIRGLEGLEEPIPLSIKNKTPTIVSLKDEGTFFIQPADVKPGGIYIYRSVLTGIMPGNFNISARVVYESPPA